MQCNPPTRTITLFHSLYLEKAGGTVEHLYRSPPAHRLCADFMNLIGTRGMERWSHFVQTTTTTTTRKKKDLKKKRKKKKVRAGGSECLTKSAVEFVGRVGALGHSVAPLTVGVDAGAVAAAERVRPRTWQQAFIVFVAINQQQQQQQR